MGRHERVLDQHVVAAGRGEADIVPAVPVDGVVGAGDQNEGGHGSIAGADGERRAAQVPVRVGAAARELEPAGEAIAALDGGRCSGRGVGSRDGDSGVLAPDLVLRRFGEEGQRPVVDHVESANPGGRGADGAEDGAQVDQRFVSTFPAAIAPGLQSAVDSGFLVRLDHRVGDLALALILQRLFPRQRQERRDTGLDLVAVRHCRGDGLPRRQCHRASPRRARANDPSRAARGQAPGVLLRWQFVHIRLIGPALAAIRRRGERWTARLRSKSISRRRTL